jgi:hypothetical protein
MARSVWVVRSGPIGQPQWGGEVAALIRSVVCGSWSDDREAGLGGLVLQTIGLRLEFFGMASQPRAVRRGRHGIGETACAARQVAVGLGLAGEVERSKHSVH